MGIWDAENFNKDYMAHAVSLVFDANFFLKSTNISLCAMSRLDLVTFQFSVGRRCAIGIVTKWCDFPPCDVTSLHLAIKLGDVTLRRVMWLKPGACSLCAPKTTTKQGSSSNKTDFCCSLVIFLRMRRRSGSHLHGSVFLRNPGDGHSGRRPLARVLAGGLW